MHKKIVKVRAGIPRNRVVSELANSTAYQRSKVRFTNKMPNRQMSRKVNYHWQIDLIDMGGEKVNLNDVPYRYILSVIDILSRFCILRPLWPTKAATV